MMNRIQRCLAVLAGFGSVLLALAIAAPAALATPAPPDPSAPSAVPPPVLHTVVVTGGMPGWQIALIAAGAALLASVAAVLLDRARAARRSSTAPAT